MNVNSVPYNRKEMVLGCSTSVSFGLAALHPLSFVTRLGAIPTYQYTLGQFGQEEIDVSLHPPHRTSVQSDYYYGPILAWIIPMARRQRGKRYRY